MKKWDELTHVFTATYTADVSGVCSVMYELGGMTVLHDPSGCNSTYTTHDEPRWYDTDSLMFVSGLDELTAVMGDDTVLIRDVAQACEDLKPRFVTLCGASIPHVIAFDYPGVARLIERETGIPVLPVATDGLQSYVSGVGLALQAFLTRFADPSDYSPASRSVNLLGVTPLDFSIGENVRSLRGALEDAGYTVNCCAAMGETFEGLCGAYRAGINLVVSSAGRQAAAHMRRACGMPWLEGLPIGETQTERVLRELEAHLTTGECGQALDGPAPDGIPEMAAGQQGILVIGEEIFARSLCGAIRALPEADRAGLTPWALWPTVHNGLSEDLLRKAIRVSRAVIADPLYRAVPEAGDVAFVPFPHEAYSGRMYRRDIPTFVGRSFDVHGLLEAALP